MIVNILTIKWGDLYGPHYVNYLYGGVRRNLSYQFRFLCFTDDPTGIRPEVETYPIPTSINQQELERIYIGRKLLLLEEGLAGLEGPCLFFDLDVVIVDSIDEFFDYAPGKFCMCLEWFPPHQVVQYKLLNRMRGGNSSIFRFEANSMQFIIDAINSGTDLPRWTYTDQRLLSYFMKDRTHWWPDRWVKSFKHRKPSFPFSYIFPPVIPKGAKIMVFNGPLKPSHALHGNLQLSPRRVCRPTSWVAKHWTG